MRHQDCAPLVLLSWHIYITRSTSTYIAETVNSSLMTTSCITDRCNHALIRWGALGTADNWSTLDTRIMSRIVFRLFAVASKHTAWRSAGRTPVFVRLLSSSQGGVPLFFFDTSLYAASLWLKAEGTMLKATSWSEPANTKGFLIIRNWIMLFQF